MIEEVDYPENYRTRVLFHANLYVGIYAELVEQNKKMAEKLLKKRLRTNTVSLLELICGRLPGYTISNYFPGM